jgi:hypothetical protein
MDAEILKKFTEKKVYEFDLEDDEGNEFDADVPCNRQRNHLDLQR